MVDRLILRRLNALDYPLRSTIVLPDLPALQAIQLILWLEEEKIRHYRIAQRLPLRQSGQSLSCSWTLAAENNWRAAVHRYILDLGGPLSLAEHSPNDLGLIQWLLCKAIALEYSDHSSEIDAILSRTRLIDDASSSHVPPLICKILCPLPLFYVSLNLTACSPFGAA